MKIHNPKLIGLIILLVGLFIFVSQMTIVYKMVVYPITENFAKAKVIGYKISRNGARMVQNSSGTKTALSGRSPFFEFETTNNEVVKTYSDALQIFFLFNYEIGEEIKVAYPNENPNKAIILSYKELPGIVFMLLFAVLCLAVGKSYLFKQTIKKNNKIFKL